MLLTVFDRYNQKRTDLSPNDNSSQVKEIQSDNVLTLSFTLYDHVMLDVNDYVDYMGERYWLMEKYRPKQKSTVEWEYDVKFYGIESLLKRFLVLHNGEPAFTLTAPPREHVALIVRCINDGMGDITDFKVGSVNGTGNIVIDYEGKYCDAALKEIAEKVGAEWWMEGQTVNVCRCEYGNEITLGYGKGLTEIDNDTADNVKLYTRLFPVGSTRNIDREKYGYSRLQLPNKAKYVDVNTEKYGIIHHYEASAFADIYPQRTGVVSSVRSEEVTGEDGTPFKIYYFKDDTLNFDPNDYEIPELVKRVSFQEGSELAGHGNEDGGSYFFEVNFNSETREFEIITVWLYNNGIQLPNDILTPKIGDKYILWNISMPSEYYTLAEKAFLDAVNRYNAQHGIDVSRYKGPTDHVYIEDNDIELFVGRRVRLESSKFFPELGYRQSRITKISRKVNTPAQMDIEICDALSTGSLSKLGDEITDIKNYTKGVADSMSFPDIIKSWDNTLPTDNNLFSARRSQQEFISKNKADRAKKKITFEEGVDFGDFISGEEGGFVDGKGNAELLTLVVRKLLSSPKFVDGFTGEGFRLWMDETGLSNLTIDKLTVRQIMTIFELLIQRVRSVGGQIVVSAANGKIKNVELSDGYYKITFEQENTFAAHDLMRCATFSGGSLKGYWVEIASVEGDSVLVEESEFAGSVPEIADECVLMGNTENPLRQSLISIAATEDGQPRVDVMDGVSNKNFSGCLRARLGNLDGIQDDWFPADKQPHGNGLYSDNAYLRGTFLLVTGEDIKTKFEIQEGKISAAVEGLRQDFASDKGYLNNPTFYDGLNKWDTENETTFFLVGNKWIWANGNVLSLKGDGAVVCTDEGRTVVRIRNKYILQERENLRSIPAFTSNSEGELEAVPVYLSFFYRCTKSGTLKVEFENVDKTGFANFNSFLVEEEIDVTDGYKQYNCNGLWNGTGDFRLSFTGDIYLYMLVLSTDRIESLIHKHKTLFEQSEKLVKIAAGNFDKDGNVLESSSIITTAKFNELMSARFNEDGSLKNVSGLVTGTDMKTWLDNGTLVGSEYVKGLVDGLSEDVVHVESFSSMFASAVSKDGNIVKKADITAFVKKDSSGNLESGVVVRADQIRLEGLVTANDNFKILSDGSIETNNAKLKGYLYSVFKPIQSSDAVALGYNESNYNDEYRLNTNLFVDATFCGVVLPVSEKYEGARVLILDSHFIKTRTATPPTTIRTENGSPIVSGLFANKNASDVFDRSIYAADKITIDSGTVELVLLNNAIRDEETGAVTSYSLQWVLISNSCQTLSYESNGQSYDYLYNHL